MKSEKWIFVIWSLSLWDISFLGISNITVPKITNIVVENWEELRFKLESDNGDLTIWNAWFTYSKNSDNPNSYKMCNRSKNGFWVVKDPFDKASIDVVISLGLGQTNSSDGIVLSNLTAINLKDYVKPGIVTKVKFQLLRDAKNINALYFQTPTYRQNMTFNITIHCLNGYKEHFAASYKRFDPHAFTKFKYIPRYTTCNISIRGISSDFRGFWSDEVVEVVRTEMSVPLAAPKLSKFGGFTVLSIDSKNLDVVIHFKELSRDEARGPLQRYRAHLLSSSKMFRIETLPLKTSFRELNDSNILIDRNVHGRDAFDSYDDDDIDAADDDFFFSSDQDDMEFHFFDRNDNKFPVDHLGHVNSVDQVGHRSEEDDKEHVSYLEINNNQDYEKIMKLISGGNVPSDHLLSPPTESNESHPGKKMAALKMGDHHHALSGRDMQVFDVDRSFDADSVFVLKGLKSDIKHSVSIDVMTKRGYNDTLELIFVDLPNFEDFKGLPEVRDVEVVFSDKSTHIFWEVANTDTSRDLVYVVYFCPEKYFHADGKGCLKFIDWFQVEISSPIPSSSSPPPPSSPPSSSSSSRPAAIRYKQEVKFADATRRDTKRMFVFGVSVATRSGPSRGVTWRSCVFEHGRDPILPRVSIFNITSDSASITIDRPKCQSGSGYISAFNVSYCTLHNDADNVCSGTGGNFILHRDVTKFELKNLKERQAYLLSVNVSDMNSVSSQAVPAVPYSLSQSQAGVVRLDQSQARQSQQPVQSNHGIFSSPNVIHFMTAEKQLPSTQVIIIHPGMMAFLAVIGVFVLGLLFLAFFVICRLYRRSVKKFNEWNTVRIDPPQREGLIESRDETLLPVNVNIPVRGNDYGDVTVIRVEQNILPPLDDRHQKHHLIGSHLDFKMEGLSLRSTTSDSFKSFSEEDDFHGNEGADDSASMLPEERSAERKRNPSSSSPSVDSLKRIGRKYQNRFLEKNSSLVAAGKVEKMFSTPTRLTKAVLPLVRSTAHVEESVGKIDMDERQGGVAFSRVLPPIAKQKVAPAVVHCFPILKLEAPSVHRESKTTRDDAKEIALLPISTNSSNLRSPLPVVSTSASPSRQTTNVLNQENYDRDYGRDYDQDYDLPKRVRPPSDENNFESDILFSSATSLNDIRCRGMTLPLVNNSSNSSFSSLAASPTSKTIDVDRDSTTRSKAFPRTFDSSSSHLICSASSSSDLLTISSKLEPLTLSSKSLSPPEDILPPPQQVGGKEDGYTGCKEHPVPPVRIDEAVLRQPALPVLVAGFAGWE